MEGNFLNVKVTTSMMEENGDLLMCKGMFRGIHPYINVVANEGPSPEVLVGWKNGQKGSR